MTNCTPIIPPYELAHVDSYFWVMKPLTRAQLEGRKAKAVRFTCDVRGDPERADEIDAESLEDHAERRKVKLINSFRKRNAIMPNGKTKAELEATGRLGPSAWDRSRTLGDAGGSTRGQTGDFLAHGRGNAWIGSAARFALRLWLALASFGFGLDLGVKLGETGVAALRCKSSNLIRGPTQDLLNPKIRNRAA